MQTAAGLKIKYFIGIDISKNKLDLAVIEHLGGVTLNYVIPNKQTDIKTWITDLKSNLPGYSTGKALFCMESTGIYTNHLLNVLSKTKASIVVENALHIKRSMGLVRDKSDKKDAYRIALHAQRNFQQLRIWQPPRPEIIRLQHLVEVRDRLITISKMLLVPLGEHGDFINEKLKKECLSSSTNSIESVKADIKKTDLLLDKIIKDDSGLNHLFQLVTSVPGVGKYTALQLLIKTNEFKSINNAKKLACYAGVAPFRIESGLSATRARVSPHANKKLKSLLHICAVRVIRLDPELKSYYLRKTVEEKKAKMLVINAIRNKLIKRVIACVNENRHYVREIVKKDCLKEPVVQ
jgi:transposase